VTLRRVVVGLDGSAGAHRALVWAAGLVAGTEAELVAVHVLSYYVEMRRDSSIETTTLWRRDLQHELDGPWTAVLREPDGPVRWRTLMLEGETASSGLMEAAEAEHADLIVVGAQGHGGIADRVLGGASYRLAHRARQPVVVVPRDWAPA
jgi:nucleotide-binding universal stress UspA family protein